MKVTARPSEGYGVRAHRLIAACLVMGWAAAVYGQVQMTDARITLTEADNDRSVALKVGQAIAVTLPENASTGYRWAVDGADAALLTVRDPEASYPSGALGSGGHVTWTFVTKAPGATTVTLKRWRHWEGDASVVQRFGFHLSIIA
jgi:inhibitor of cysteine peptidase